MAQAPGALGISSSVDLPSTGSRDLRARQLSRKADKDIELTPVDENFDQNRDQNQPGWASNGHAAGTVPEFNELHDVPLASPFHRGFSQRAPTARHPPPLRHHWNWFAILIFFFYLAASGFYFYVRITYSMINGPGFT